jgi:carbon monoxide dehydrogenase subunit G
MAKFPTEVEESVIVAVPPAHAYEYLRDVVRSSAAIPGLARCEPAGTNTYRFTYAERSQGPIRLTVRYTARYSGDGRTWIAFEGIAAPEDNTDVSGEIRVEPVAANTTRVTVRHMLAPDTPVPRLLQGLVRGHVEREARAGLSQFLGGVKRALEGDA